MSKEGHERRKHTKHASTPKHVVYQTGRERLKFSNKFKIHRHSNKLKSNSDLKYFSSHFEFIKKTKIFTMRCNFQNYFFEM